MTTAVYGTRGERLTAPRSLSDLCPLRIDDIGASSKQWEWHGRGLGTVWPLSHRRLFGRWGPYPELTAWQLEAICAAVDAHDAQVTLAVTALWMERDGREVVYPVKYPAQTAVIRRWVRRGTVEVANHGLRHCQPHDYRPRWTGNRSQHREFTGAEGPDEMVRTVRRAQDLLEAAFGERPVTFVPPGLQFPYTDYALAEIPELTTIVRAPAGAVWHDRDFVTDRQALPRFRTCLAAGRYTTVRAWRAACGPGS